MSLIFQKIIAPVLLGVLSIQDIRQKKVPVLWLIFLGVPGMVFTLWEITTNPDAWSLYLTGVLPGLGLLLVGKLTNNQMGSGDGYALMAVGLYVGIWKCLSCLFYGTLFCAGTGIVLMITRKKEQTDTMPFLPFLLVGYLFSIW